MTVAHPALLLAGLLAVVTPIIIHILFRRRRKPIPWAAMRFLLDAYRQQRRRTQLQQIILLTLRCLLIALVALALARPSFDAGSALSAGTGGRTIYLVVDTSLASATTNTETGETALDIAKAKAAELLADFNQADRVALVTTGSPARARVLPPSADAAGVRSVVEQLEPTAARADLAGAFALIAQDIQSTDANLSPVTVALLSPLTRGSLDVTAPLEPMLSAAAQQTPVSIVRFSNNSEQGLSPQLQTSNTWVSSVQPIRRVLVPGDAAGSDRTVLVSLERDSTSEPFTTPVRLLLASSQDADSEPTLLGRVDATFNEGERTTNVRINLGSAAADVLRAAVGDAALIAQLDRDSNDLDNTRAAPIAVRDAIRVGIVARRGASFGSSPTAPDRGAAALTSAQWWTLALTPTQRTTSTSASTSVDIVNVDPAQIDRPVLLGLDAMIITEPDLVGGGGWDLVADFTRAGGMLIVTPAADVQTQLWLDNFERAFGFPFTLSREPMSLDQDAARVRVPDAQPDLLRVVAAELADIAPSAAALQWLTIERSTQSVDTDPLSGASVLLQLQTGSETTPWILAAPVPQLAGDQRSFDPGLVVLFTSAVDVGWTTLPLSSLMVPLAQELIRQGVGQADAQGQSIAGTRWSLSRTARAYGVGALSASIGSYPINLTDTGISNDPIRRAGVVRVTNASGETVAIDAINPALGAGDTTPLDPRALDAALAGALGSSDPEIIRSISDTDSATAFDSQENGKQFAAQLLLAALVIAAIELVLARVFSVPERGRASLIDKVRSATLGADPARSPTESGNRRAHQRGDAA